MSNITQPTPEQVAEIAQRAAAEASAKLAEREVLPGSSVVVKPKVKREKPKSRTQRWHDAISIAQKALEALRTAASELDSAVADLESVREEYADWRDNLPENLQQSSLGEKLDAVADFEFADLVSAINDAADEVENTLGEAEGADLPLGFGRD